MLTRKQKEKLVADLAAEIAAGKSVTLVDFGGLSANDMVSLKKELRAIGAPLKIVKKSLLGLAMAKAEINADRNTFDGQIAVSVATQDEVGPAKVIADFAKKNENIKFVGGVLDKEVLSAEQIKALAKLPSRDQLRGQLVGTINAPLSGLVNVLAGNLRSLVTVLKAIGESK